MMQWLRALLFYIFGFSAAILYSIVALLLFGGVVTAPLAVQVAIGRGLSVEVVKLVTLDHPHDPLVLLALPAS